MKLEALKSLPCKLVCVSAFSSDLAKLKEMAEHMMIPFEGYLFASKQKILLNEEVLSLELQCLDRLLTNAEAACISNDGVIN